MPEKETNSNKKLSQIRIGLYNLFYSDYNVDKSVVWEHYHKTESVIQDIKSVQTQPKNISKNNLKQNNTKSKSNLCQKRLIMNDKDILVLDDILQLLSIILMSIGEDNHPTAQYSKLSTIKRLLYQIKNEGVYDTETTIKIKISLTNIKIIIDNYTKTKKNDVIFPLVVNKYLTCTESLISLESSINNKILNIDNTLLPFLDSLLNLKQKVINLPSISLYLASQKKNQDLNLLQTPEEKARVTPLENEVKSLELELKRLNKEISASITNTHQGKEIIYSLYEECKILFQDFCASSYNYNELMDDKLKPIFEQLMEMKYFWDKIIGIIIVGDRKLTCDTMEKNLGWNRKKLENIQELRDNGVFSDEIGKPLQGKSTIIYLLGRCYSLTRKFFELYDTISESLMSVYAELVRTRTILGGLKDRDGVKTKGLGRLTNCSAIVIEATNKRVNGEVVVDEGSAPIGQDILFAFLDECINIYYDRKEKYSIDI